MSRTVQITVTTGTIRHEVVKATWRETPVSLKTPPDHVDTYQYESDADAWYIVSPGNLMEIQDSTDPFHNLRNFLQLLVQQ